MRVLGIDETRRGRPRWECCIETQRWVRVDPWDTEFVDLDGEQGLLGQRTGRTSAAVIEMAAGTNTAVPGGCRVRGLQGGVTPTVRHGHIKLANGATAVLGDAHATVDPLLGQGGNMASYAAHLLGQQIVSADIFDEDFFVQVDARRANLVLGATRWTNFMLSALNTLPDAFTEFLGAVAENRGLADKFTDNFNYPEKQWDLFSNPDSVGPWIAKNSSVSQESQRPSHRPRPPATASWIGRTRGDGSPMTLMLTASDTARAVRSGDRDPVAVAGEALTRIAAGNAALGAFHRQQFQNPDPCRVPKGLKELALELVHRFRHHRSPEDFRFPIIDRLKNLSDS